MNKTLLEMVHRISKDSHLFCMLTDEELERLSKLLEERHYTRGEVIFREAEPGNFIGIISSGKVTVSKSTEFPGKEVILAKNGPGSFIGELSTIDGHPRSASVTAIEDTNLLLLTRETIEKLDREAPSLSLKIHKGLIRVLGLRLRQSAERLSQIF